MQRPRLPTADDAPETLSPALVAPGPNIGGRIQGTGCCLTGRVLRTRSHCKDNGTQAAEASTLKVHFVSVNPSVINAGLCEKNPKPELARLQEVEHSTIPEGAQQVKKAGLMAKSLLFQPQGRSLGNASKPRAGLSQVFASPLRAAGGPSTWGLIGGAPSIPGIRHVALDNCLPGVEPLNSQGIQHRMGLDMATIPSLSDGPVARKVTAAPAWRVSAHHFTS